MNNSRKVVKLNRDIKINPATIVVIVVVIYVAISLVISLRREPITTYKVNKSNVSNNIMLEGICLRNEQIITTPKSGYTCYVVRDGEKVKYNSAVCTIDETGQVYDTISNSEEYDDLLQAEDYNEIRNVISLYKTGYSDVEFYSSYNFENNLHNKVIELANEIIIQQMTADGNNHIAITSVLSNYSGLVTYYIDGFENVTVNDINKDSFNKSNYEKATLKTGDIVSENTAVAKVVPSEDWNIVAPITDEELAQISDSTNVRIKINNSNFIAYMPYEIVNGSDGKYINIILNKYMSNFVSERYVSVEIIKQEDEGLKIPTSACIQKDVYMIPINYLSAGGNQTATNKINVSVMGENGDISLKQISPIIYKTDEQYCYVDKNSFEDTDVLYDINSNETLAVSLLSSCPIDGVYTANHGTAEFKMITIIKTIDDFVLIDSSQEIKIYDNIVLNAKDVTENQIIY